MAAPKFELFRDHPLMVPTETAGITIETVRVRRPTLGHLKATMADPDGPMAFVTDQTGRALGTADFDQMLAEDFEAIDALIQGFLPLRWRREMPEAVQPSQSQP